MPNVRGDSSDHGSIDDGAVVRALVIPYRHNDSSVAYNAALRSYGLRAR
jgi:hypothetical protein